MTEIIRDENYCKDCIRSIYAEYPDCDVNIENNGKYQNVGKPCYCKITKDGRAEKYPWELRGEECPSLKNVRPKEIDQ